jgi:hypothetical protein
LGAFLLVSIAPLVLSRGWLNVYRTVVDRNRAVRRESDGMFEKYIECGTTAASATSSVGPSPHFVAATAQGVARW